MALVGVAIAQNSPWLRGVGRPAHCMLGTAGRCEAGGQRPSSSLVCVRWRECCHLSALPSLPWAQASPAPFCPRRMPPLLEP